MTDLMKDFEDFFHDILEMAESHAGTTSEVFNDLLDVADQYAAGDVVYTLKDELKIAIEDSEVYSMKERLLELWEDEFSL